jgi:hypothetical protein
MLPIVKERLVKFATTKGLKPYLFAEKNLLASSTFANKSEISTENLVKVFTNYPELNFDWVITGRGNMLFSKTEIECNKCVDWEKKYNELMEEYRQISKKTMVLQDEAITYLRSEKKQ